MNPQSAPGSGDRPWYVLGPEDPPIDFSREQAAYAKQAERLLRDHPGKIVLVHEDEVVGVFNDPDEAYEEAWRRFGDVKVMVTEIYDPNGPPDFVSWVDVNHPSLRRLDRDTRGEHGQVHGGH